MRADYNTTLIRWVDVPGGYVQLSKRVNVMTRPSTDGKWELWSYDFSGIMRGPDEFVIIRSAIELLSLTWTDVDAAEAEWNDSVRKLRERMTFHETGVGR